MGLDFVQTYGGRRLEGNDLRPPQWNAPTAAEQDEIQIELDYEIRRNDWAAVDLKLPEQWRPGDWDERPRRFVDGKDVGQTIAWLRSPEGYPVPIRLSEIGSAVMRVADGECRREFAVVERVVAMITEAFSWEEVESFAIALQAHGLRFLPAKLREGASSYDFEQMRRATQHCSNEEMSALEKAALAGDTEVSTIVDGRLEPLAGGFDPAGSPVFGVIKTHYRNYLHPQGLQLLYQLKIGQRTPVFSLPEKNLPIISWYLRLSEAAGATPNWGVVRVEASKNWFEADGRDWSFVDRLSRTICDYRCREHRYSRAPVSLHPIVRAEESLRALFSSPNMLSNNFYRLTGL